MKETKYVSREEAISLCEEAKEIFSREKHDHRIYMDEHGVLRWEGDPIIEMISPAGEFDCLSLNTMFMNGASKNDPRVRELYRKLGYSLFGYWEVFHWDVNNPQAEEYKE
jgi:hypothetical protein